MANVFGVRPRKKCYQAALKSGHNTYLGSNGPLYESRKQKLVGWIEEPLCDHEVGRLNFEESFCKLKLR